MLYNLTRKLFPFMSIAIATIGCGKRITDPIDTPFRQTENQELPSAYVLTLAGSQGSRKNYWLPRPAQFEIPRRLRVIQGVTLRKGVEIAFDVNEFDSDDFQFKCSYSPSLEPTEMHLNVCVDYDGNEFGEVAGQRFTLRTDDIVQIRFTGERAQDLEVDAVFSMKWI
jgi:hypothetical protein